MASSIDIPNYYAGKTIFITGATGFVGTVLIEKLLRCCPDINKIYILMRQKKGHSVEKRLCDFVNCQVFDKLNTNSPKCLEKLQIIPGDVVEDNLGISVQDWKTLQEECQIFFHCAACVRFNMPIREALQMNTAGTMKALKLAEGMKKLEVYLQLSTSYCHCELNTMEEILYPAKHDPKSVLEYVDKMDDKLLRKLEPSLVEPQPNTYAYTKSLCEELVSQYAGRFPIGIARPSVITPAYKEPMPGWVDNINGPTGVLLAGSKGIIHTMLCDPDIKADIMPVDFIVNGCIVFAYATAIDRSKELKICNLTHSSNNPITWGEVARLAGHYYKDCPSSQCFWYPGLTLTPSRMFHVINAVLKQWIPALVIDLLMVAMFKKPFMIKVQKRVAESLRVLHDYSTRDWQFINTNFRSLRNRLSKADNEMFYTDIDIVDWHVYMKNYVMGIRQYCSKDDPATIPIAKRLFNQLYYLNLATKTGIFTICLYLIYCCLTNNI